MAGVFAVPEADEYRAKRGFAGRGEPQGGERLPREGGGIFVVQKHDATRLHYDFRLEHAGVLWSWAVTRGPSLDPAQKRLAVHVEDHPLDYASFEGTIPKGAYGGGAVIVWDEGSWVPEGDPAEGMAKGRLSFSLEGRKLNGAWHLLRMRSEKRDNWLLVKGDDAFARREGDVLQDAPASVRSGRTIEDVGGRPAASAAEGKPRRAARSGTGGNAKPKRGPAGGGAALTHPDKLLWPEAGISKGDLLGHYERAWERMAPFLRDRPLTLVRSPDGRKRFFQQHGWAGMPDAVRTLRDPADGAELLVVRDFEGLAALVQFGTVEIHGWGARAGALQKPDQITFDLDPDEGMDVDKVRRAAFAVRDRLAERNMTAFVKTSGGKGFHVAAPLKPQADWKAVERFASGLAHGMAADEPGRFTAASALAERSGRIFVDYLRNNANAMTVLPWSSRARATATVCVPITWEALEAGAGPADFALGSDALAAVLRAEDAWASFRNAAEPLEE